MYKRQGLGNVQNLAPADMPVSTTQAAAIGELINHRYFNKLPVIVSTELSIENLVNIDEALGSRLIEMSKDFLVGIRNKKLNYRIYR